MHLMEPDTANLIGDADERAVYLAARQAWHAELVRAVDLVAPQNVPRMPPEPWEQTMIAGNSVPCIALQPFEASAPLKLKVALFRAAQHRGGA